MKSKDWKILALMGLSGGLLLAAQGEGANNSAKDTSKEAASSEDPNEGNLGYHLMTEEELLIELSPEGTAMYNSLTPEGKELARKVASMRCGGSNECKGLNACKSDKNACAGKGSCKGQGICAYSDKNLAVKVVKEKMAAKRDNALQTKK